MPFWIEDMYHPAIPKQGSRVFSLDGVTVRAVAHLTRQGSSDQLV
jgi:hypothetical protein